MRQKQRKDSSAPNCALELRSEDSKRDELNIKLSPEQQPALTDPEPLMAPPVQILRANTDRKGFFYALKKYLETSPSCYLLLSACSKTRAAQLYKRMQIAGNKQLHTLSQVEPKPDCFLLYF